MIAIGYNPAHNPNDQEHWAWIEPERHVLVAGKTGTGKSTVMLNAMLDQIAAGEGILAADPHGPIVEAALTRIPTDRTQDVIYVDPKAGIVGLNPFDHPDTEIVKATVKDLIQTSWPEGWGPETDNILSFILNAVCDTWRLPTLPLCQRFAADEKFRKSVVRKLRPSETRFFFEETYDKEWDKRMRAEKSAPVRNKLNKFVNDAVLRRMFEPTKSLDFRRAIDERKIVLVNLSKERIGRQLAAFIGGLVAFKHQAALLSRQDSSEPLSPSYAFYDEFLTFMHGDFSAYLGETRKYGGRLMIATQTLAPVPEFTRQIILGNVGTFIVYRVSREDAEIFAKEFGNDFGPTALTDQPDYSCHVKTVRGGVPQAVRQYRAFAPRERTRPTATRAAVLRTFSANFGRRTDDALRAGGEGPAGRRGGEGARPGRSPEAEGADRGADPGFGGQDERGEEARPAA